MSPAQGVEAFARVVAGGMTQPVVTDFASLPEAPLFAELPRPATPVDAAEPASGGGEPLLELFLVEEAEREATIAAHLAERIALVFRTTPGRLNRRQPLANLGLDSLMAGEVTAEIRTSYGVAVPIQDVFGLSLTALARQVASRVQLDEELLAALLDDPYAAVRHVAGDALSRQPGFEGFAYDFTAPGEERRRHRDEVLGGDPRHAGRVRAGDGREVPRDRFDASNEQGGARRDGAARLRC